MGLGARGIRPPGFTPVSPRAARGALERITRGQETKRGHCLILAPGFEPPGRAPCPGQSQTLAPPRPRLLPCEGCADSTDAVRLRLAQRPTGPRTNGEAKNRRSYPRRPCRQTRSCQHLVRCLRERWSPGPPHPLPRPAPAWTPPSREPDTAHAQSGPETPLRRRKLHWASLRLPIRPRCLTLASAHAWLRPSALAPGLKAPPPLWDPPPFPDLAFLPPDSGFCSAQAVTSILWLVASFQAAVWTNVCCLTWVKHVNSTS